MADGGSVGNIRIFIFNKIWTTVTSIWGNKFRDNTFIGNFSDTDFIFKFQWVSGVVSTIILNLNTPVLCYFNRLMWQYKNYYDDIRNISFEDTSW